MRVVELAEKASERKADFETAKVFCSKQLSGDHEAFETCVEQLKQHLLGLYETYSDEVSEHSHLEQNRMQEQEKLMQSRMVAAH